MPPQNNNPVDPSTQPSPVAQPIPPSTPPPPVPAPVTPTSPQPSVSPEPIPINNLPPAGSSSGNTKSPKTKLIIVVAVVIGLILIVAAVFLLKGSNGTIAKTARNITGSNVKLEDYTSPKGYSVKVFSGWTKEEKDGEYTQQTEFNEPVDLKDGNENSKYRAAIIVDKIIKVSQYSHYQNADAYFADSKESIKSIVSSKPASENSQRLTATKEENITINGKPAYKVEGNVQNFSYSKGVNGKAIFAYIYVDPKTQYELQLGAHDSDGKFYDKFNEVINSFTIK